MEADEAIRILSLSVNSGQTTFDDKWKCALKLGIKALINERKGKGEEIKQCIEEKMR